MKQEKKEKQEKQEKQARQEKQTRQARQIRQDKQTKQKKHGKKSKIVVTVLLGLLDIVLLAVVILYVLQNFGADTVSTREKQEAGTEEVIEKVTDGATGEAISEEASEEEAPEGEMPEVEVQGPKNNSQNNSKESVQAEQQGPQPEAKEFQVQAVSAGTIVEKEKLDFAQLANYFTSEEIPQEVYDRINGKSYRENENIALEDLRYLKMLHYNFEHQIQVGEMIVNQSAATDVKEIFEQLFESGYEICSMYLVDNYWINNDGNDSDTNSIEHNNTSAFNYREVSGMTGTGILSNHAKGLAIDINPQQNPYVIMTSGTPQYSHENASGYIDRTTGAAHMITHEDLCYQLFAQKGFAWGGDWTEIIDYQHFERP